MTGLGTESRETLAELRGESPPTPMEQDAENFLVDQADDDEEWEDVGPDEDIQEAITFAIRDVMVA